ncbi:MAG: flagellar hook-basal body protein [Candidatus Abyssobacteria bacterium SURF_5]|uniref:Flagellar hook-basal body protein n=1 Tax=Abyssobacteria bacterium (strain SURF_5) TaxID=2093360 RepID=A0A3A4P0A3_ABYX5|nr:MAG: flagellar hook-basal body protein [Candidatus Abyssubacteria bacterium SURF_5]
MAHALLKKNQIQLKSGDPKGETSTTVLRGIYTAASGMIAQGRRVDVISNNLANVGTTGFKRSQPAIRGFHQIFSREIMRYPPARGIDNVDGGGAAVNATIEDFSQGPTIESGNPLDLALEGPGFFVVRTPLGDRYSRAGNFSLNSLGHLVTREGYPVLGREGPIIIHGETVRISANGDVLVNDVPAETILVVDFPKPYPLTPYGDSLFGATEAGATASFVVPDPRVRVGALEGSNVNPIAELVSLMSAARSYESSQRAVQALDESLDAAVNRIARV